MSNQAVAMRDVFRAARAAIAASVAGLMCASCGGVAKGAAYGAGGPGSAEAVSWVEGRPFYLHLHPRDDRFLVTYSPRSTGVLFTAERRPIGRYAHEAVAEYLKGFDCDVGEPVDQNPWYEVAFACRGADVRALVKSQIKAGRAGEPLRPAS